MKCLTLVRISTIVEVMKVFGVGNPIRNIDEEKCDRNSRNRSNLTDSDTIEHFTLKEWASKNRRKGEEKSSSEGTMGRSTLLVIKDNNMENIEIKMSLQRGQ